MSAPVFPWLPAGSDPEAEDDPWRDVAVPDVVLTPAQEDFLASFAEQPSVPRLRHLTDPIAAFEEPGTDA